MLPSVDWFIPSIEEARELTGEEAPEAAARSLRGQGARNVVLTLGGDGVLALAEAGRILRLPAHDIAVVDTTGCGDCFSAGVIAGSARGWPLERTLRFATAASALVAMALARRACCSPSKGPCTPWKRCLSRRFSSHVAQIARQPARERLRAGCFHPTLNPSGGERLGFGQHWAELPELLVEALDRVGQRVGPAHAEHDGGGRRRLQRALQRRVADAGRIRSA